MLEQINALLVQKLGPLGPVLAVAGLGLLLLLVTAVLLMKPKEDPLTKLARERKAGTQAADPGTRSLRQAKGNDKLDRYASFLEPQDQGEFSAMRLKLTQAGYRGKQAVRMFHFAQFALGLGLMALGMLYALLLSVTSEPTTTKMIGVILGPGLVGYYLPQYWVKRRIQERQDQITNGFPDALDMMLVCVEAGQSLDQSIIRVAKELRASYPSLSDEFEIVSYEIKAGKDKPTVLADMGERCGVADISSFVTVLVQSASFGTSIADALRVYAEEMRDKRVMRAEEKANKLPTKMTLVTMMLTVPPLLIILIGPSVVGIQQLGNM